MISQYMDLAHLLGNKEVAFFSDRNEELQQVRVTPM